MIKNYIKNAIRNFSRNKFITFINIFGISFTIFILTVLYSFINLQFSTNNPNENKFKTLFLDQMQMKAFRMDTIYEIDSSQVNEKWVYDTIDYKTKRKPFSDSNSSISYQTVKKYLTNLKEYLALSFASSSDYNIFLPSGKLNASVNYANHQYWDVFPYKLIEGRYFNEEDERSMAYVAVITKKFAQKYFGDQPAINQEIKFDNKSWKIIGIVQNPREYSEDCIVPFTHLPPYILDSKNPLGGFHVAFLVNDNQQMRKLKQELALTATKIEPYEKYNEFHFFPMNFVESYVQSMMGVSAENTKKAYATFKFRLLLFGGFFLLLPLLNLLNINISRIMDRRAEIGIRKSFGATSIDIFYQFLLENILLSLFAGLLALIASYFCIKLINNSEALPDPISLNLGVVIFGIFASFIFGILFGVLPAFRLSKQNIVKSLNS